MSEVLHEVQPFEEFDTVLEDRCQSIAARYGVTYHAGYYHCPKCRKGWRRANTAKMCCYPMTPSGARKANPRRKSRPRIVLDEARVEQLAATGMSLDAMAGEFKCSRKVMVTNYGEAIARGRLTYYSTEYTGEHRRGKKNNRELCNQLPLM